MVFGILVGTGVFYLIFADGKIQSWNDPKAATNTSNNADDNDIEFGPEMKENYMKSF